MSVFSAIEERLDAEIFSLRQNQNEAVEDIKVAITALYCTPRFTSANKEIIETALRMALEKLTPAGRGGCFPERPDSQPGEKSEFLPEGF